MKSVVLLSGGLDSATVLALVSKMGDEVHALSFRYGQRHSIELECAANLAKEYGVRKYVILDIPTIGGSALTDLNVSVPKNTNVSEIGSGIPPTYVPARNTIFLAFAVSYAESIGSNRIFIGVNALDYSGYPDCRPEYISAFQNAVNLGTKSGGMEIFTPLISMTKAEIIRIGISLGVDYSKTSSCYDPVGRLPCGKCDSCLLRQKGFDEAAVDGTPDSRYIGST